jgi:DNA-binding NarL/FixJ family response regulator
VRLLVADDHSLFRDGLVSLLEAAGFEVVGQVGDGRAAVEAALRLRPDVVLLDLTMPVLTGLEALVEIRAAWPSRARPAPAATCSRASRLMNLLKC